MPRTLTEDMKNSKSTEDRFRSTCNGAFTQDLIARQSIADPPALTDRGIP